MTPQDDDKVNEEIPDKTDVLDTPKQVPLGDNVAEKEMDLK